jgi:hypothetical protein
MKELVPGIMDLAVFLGNWMPQGVSTINGDKVSH